MVLNNKIYHSKKDGIPYHFRSSDIQENLLNLANRKI